MSPESIQKARDEVDLLLEKSRVNLAKAEQHTVSTLQSRSFYAAISAAQSELAMSLMLRRDWDVPEEPE